MTSGNFRANAPIRAPALPEDAAHQGDIDTKHDLAPLDWLTSGNKARNSTKGRSALCPPRKNRSERCCSRREECSQAIASHGERYQCAMGSFRQGVRLACGSDTACQIASQLPRPTKGSSRNVIPREVEGSLFVYISYQFLKLWLNVVPLEIKEAHEEIGLRQAKPPELILTKISSTSSIGVLSEGSSSTVMTCRDLWSPRINAPTDVRVGHLFHFGIIETKVCADLASRDSGFLGPDAHERSDGHKAHTLAIRRGIE